MQGPARDGAGGVESSSGRECCCQHRWAGRGFLGTNVWSPGPGAAATESQLLGWELVVPSRHDVAAVHRSLRTAGYVAEHTPRRTDHEGPLGDAHPRSRRGAHHESVAPVGSPGRQSQGLTLAGVGAILTTASRTHPAHVVGEP